MTDNGSIPSLIEFIDRVRDGVLALYPNLTAEQLHNALIVIAELHPEDTITTGQLITELIDVLAQQIGPPPEQTPRPFNLGG